MCNIVFSFQGWLEHVAKQIDARDNEPIVDESRYLIHEPYNASI